MSNGFIFTLSKAPFKAQRSELSSLEKMVGFNTLRRRAGSGGELHAAADLKMYLTICSQLDETQGGGGELHAAAHQIPNDRRRPCTQMQKPKSTFIQFQKRGALALAAAKYILA